MLWLASAVAVGLFLWCAVARVPYSFELSKMEGGFVDHARWAAAGRPLYAPPSAEFVPFLYMPLAHHVAGWLIRAGLNGYLATRIVALVGILGATLIGMALVARATTRRGLVWLVPVLVCARYFDVECFYDQARPDNLMALFCMAATFALALPSARVAVPLFVVSGLLAFFTKQSSALFLAVLLAGQLWVRWRVAIGAGFLLAVTAIPLFLYFNHESGGWLKQYTFTIASHHRVDLKGLVTLASSEFLVGFLLVTLLLIVALVATLRDGRPKPAQCDARRLAWHAAFTGTLAAAAFSFASSTQVLAVRNVYVILAVASAAFVPLAVEWAIERFVGDPRRATAWSTGWLALAISIALGVRDPRSFRPTARDTAAWREMHANLARFGPPEHTWVMLHGAAWGGNAGDPFHLHFGALSDLIGGYYGKKTGIDIPRDLVTAIEQHQFTAIVVSRWDKRALELLSNHYERDPSIPAQRLPSFSGYDSGASEIWVPKRAP